MDTLNNEIQIIVAWYADGIDGCKKDVDIGSTCVVHCTLQNTYRLQHSLECIMQVHDGHCDDLAYLFHDH